MLRLDFKELDADPHEEGSDWWHYECSTFRLHLILPVLHTLPQKDVPYGMDQDIGLTV